MSASDLLSALEILGVLLTVCVCWNAGKAEGRHERREGGRHG